MGVPHLDLADLRRQQVAQCDLGRQQMDVVIPVLLELANHIPREGRHDLGDRQVVGQRAASRRVAGQGTRVRQRQGAGRNLYAAP